MKIRDSLSAAAVVLFITVTVWMVADRSLLRTSNVITVDVQANCESPDYRVTVVRPETGKLDVRFTGPGRKTADLQRPPCRFSFSPTRAERAVRAGGELTLQARDGFDWLADEGITLEESAPPDIQVKVEAIKRVPVPVQLDPEDKKDLDAEYAIERAEVKATLTESALKDVGDRQWWAAPHLNLKSAQLESGQTDEQTCELRPSLSGLEATFDPPTVRVTKLRLTTFVAPRTIADKIHVQLQGPPEIFDQYDVELEVPDIVNLTVRGPRAEVDALKPDDVAAVLVLTPEDKPNPGGAPFVRPLEIRFPNHERVRLDGDPPRVNFNLKKRKAAGPE